MAVYPSLPVKMAEEPIKTISKAFNIIDKLAELDSAGATRLAKEMDIPKTTAHAYLRTLESNNIVYNNDGAYNLSLQFLDYAGGVRKDLDIYSAAWPEVQALALETREHANLMIEEFGYGRYIYISEGADSAALDTYTGMTTHLHSTALGKSILASTNRECVKNIIERRGLPQFTENTIGSVEGLFDELEMVQEQEYAENYQERVLGVSGIAMPISQKSGSVVGAVGISGPASRIEEKIDEGKIINDIKQKANIIELNLTN